MFTEIQNTIK